MLNEEVTSGNGVVKNVVAQNQDELDEAVKAVKAEKSAVAPDILDPSDGNKIVSPDNKHTEDIPSEVNNDVEPSEEAPQESPKSSPKVSKKK